MNQNHRSKTWKHQEYSILSTNSHQDINWSVKHNNIVFIVIEENYRFGCIQEKRKLNARDISSTIRIILQNWVVSLSGNKFRTFFSNCTTIQRLKSQGSLFYWNRFECMWKKRGFWKGRRENGFERKRKCKDVSSV